MDNYKSVLHFTLTVSLCLIGLIFSSKDATAAIVANDGGITLWVSWDDLDNPGKDIDEVMNEADSAPGGYDCLSTNTGRSALGAPSSPASCPASGPCTGRDKLTGDIDKFADYIWQSTEGAHYLRRVYVSDEGRSWEHADIKWNIGVGGSSAAGGGWNNPTRQLTMQSAYRTCIHDVLHHELGHYLYNLPDRYERSGSYYRGRFGAGTAFNVDGTQRDTNTVMSNNYPHLFVDTTNAIIGIDYTDPATGSAVSGEILTPDLLTDADPSNDGPNRAHHNHTNPFAQDEWSLLPERHVDLAGVHDEGAFPSPGAIPPVEIVFQENGDDTPPPGRVLLLDRSGSMSVVTNGVQAVQFVQEAGMFLYHSSDPTDRVATYLYNGAVEELFPYDLYDPANELVFASFRNASGLTDIAGALEAAIDAFILEHGEVGVPGSEIFLLSDGVQTTGASLETQVSRAAERGIRIHTFSFGGADAETMASISTSTGGSTAPLSEQENGAALKSVMMEQLEEMRGRTAIAFYKGVLSDDTVKQDPTTGTAFIEGSFEVPKGSLDLHFYTSSPNGDVSTDLQLELIDPFGVQINSGTPNNVAKLGRFAGLKIEKPASGSWTFRLRSFGSTFPSYPLNFSAYALKRDLDTKVDFSRIAGGNVFSVKGTAFDRYPLSGIEATAILYLGGTRIGTLALTDDGQSGGDATASDGIYSGILDLSSPRPSLVEALLVSGANRLRADVEFRVLSSSAGPAEQAHYETGSEPAYVAQDYALNGGGDFSAWASGFTSFLSQEQGTPRIVVSLPKGQAVERGATTAFTAEIYDARPLSNQVRFSAGRGASVNATEIPWSSPSSIGRAYKVEIGIDPVTTLGSRDFTVQFGQEILQEKDAIEVIPAPEPSAMVMLGSGLFGLAVAARRRSSPS
jgi:hypothetical protein